MEFVQKFTPLDFQAETFTVLVIKTQKMSENGKIYTGGKIFTLPPAVTAWTNLTSEKWI